MIKEQFIKDKSFWPKGPWRDEPFFSFWQDKKTSLNCVILRGMTGVLYGYVGSPKKIKSFDKIDVHGGITFPNTYKSLEFMKRWREDIENIYDVDLGDFYYLGFDCAHMNDLQPLLFFGIEEDDGIKKLKKSFKKYQTYKDINFVKGECAKLAKQLKELRK